MAYGKVLQKTMEIRIKLIGIKKNNNPNPNKLSPIKIKQRKPPNKITKLPPMPPTIK